MCHIHFFHVSQPLNCIATSEYVHETQQMISNITFKTQTENSKLVIALVIPSGSSSQAVACGDGFTLKILAMYSDGGGTNVTHDLYTSRALIPQMSRRYFKGSHGAQLMLSSEVWKIINTQVLVDKHVSFCGRVMCNILTNNQICVHVYGTGTRRVNTSDNFGPINATLVCTSCIQHRSVDCRLHGLIFLSSKCHRAWWKCESINNKNKKI